MRTITVELGEKEFEIHELPTRLNEAWRQQLQQKLAPITAIVEAAMTLELSREDAGAIARQAQQVLQVAMASPGDIREMVLAYADELRRQEEYLLDHAYDSEFVAAFMQILGLAYPFGGLVQALGVLREVGDSGTATSGPAAP